MTRNEIQKVTILREKTAGVRKEKGRENAEIISRRYVRKSYTYHRGIPLQKSGSRHNRQPDRKAIADLLCPRLTGKFGRFRASGPPIRLKHARAGHLHGQTTSSIGQRRPLPLNKGKST